MSETCLLQLMEDAVQEEYDLYEGLYNLSERQLELLGADDPDVDAIADLMNRKMDLIGQIQSVENRHIPVKEQWEQNYLQYSPQEREGLSQFRERELKLIERLHRMEDEIAQGIKHCEADINRRLNNLQIGRTANQAYFSYERLPPKYIDKRK